MSDHAVPADPVELLARAANAITADADLQSVASQVLGDAALLAGASRVALFTRDPDDPALHLAAAIGYAADERAALAAAVAADAAHPIAVAARGGRVATERVAIREDGADAAVDLPLTITRDGIDVALGVASFAWAGGHDLDAPSRTTLRAAADLVAVAVDRARLASLVGERSEWLERIAGLDLMTGLANRRTMDRVLELEIERAKRQRSDISLAVFDVDGFRALNERDGTSAGDEVLRAIAATLLANVRLVDTVARVGGDEFVVIAPGSGGIVVADRILRAIDALQPVRGTPVTVSAGVAHFPSDGDSGESLLLAALGALAGARAAGTGAIAEVRAG